jgi:hypothetical protein
MAVKYLNCTALWTSYPYKKYLYLFICSLFNDAANNSYYVALNDRIVVNNELERIWKEAVVAEIYH